MKKYYFSHLSFLLLFLFFGFFHSEKIFAAEAQCAIQSGPIKELTEYGKRIQTELSNISATALKSNPSCNNRPRISVSGVFDAAYADIIAFKHIQVDFAYNAKIAFQGNAKSAIRRDEKFFDTIEKNIEKTTEKLSNSCALDDATLRSLHDMIIEVQMMKSAYQSTAIGKSVTDFTGIRSENIATATAMSQAYSPAQTVNCSSNSKTEKKFGETLKSALSTGGKMDKALESWRKAIALIRGGGK